MGTDPRGVNGVCLFGGHHAGYPRSAVLLEGLRRLGVPVVKCVVSPRWKSPRRYPALLSRYASLRDAFDVLFVPEFCHKDVPLAAALAQAGGKLCVFDPLVSRYDTRVHDRRDVARAGAQAWHNRNLDRITMSLPDLVLADTAAHAGYFRGLAAPGTRIGVVPVGYDDALFRAVPEPAAPPVRVLFFGSFLPLHGVDVIVEAAHLLRGRHDIEFELIGDGQTLHDVTAKIRGYALERLRLRPRVSMDELPARIARAHVCLGIFGSTAKASRVVPNKVFQCMGTGRVVISGDTPAMREFFVDGTDVWLVPVGDGAALAAAIDRLAGDARLRSRIAEAAIANVQRNFSPLPLASRFLAHCEAAMA
ncbi:MAG TPA: glycosyltransferase [Candidatus Krumholzibacteria bacterium]|nr:glycosyltransferase [Candidatus Krumholzibacteria bacterium]